MLTRLLFMINPGIIKSSTSTAKQEDKGIMRKTYFLAWFGLLLLLSCQSGQQKNTPEQSIDTVEAMRTNQDEMLWMGPDTEDKTATQVPDNFNQFVGSLPEWTADTIGKRDIFYSDADTEQEYAGMFDMRNRLEEKESISVSSRFLYKVSLENCYVIFVEKMVSGCPTANGFYTGRWTHSMMTCTKDGKMIEKIDLGNNYIDNIGSCLIRGTRLPLRLEVEQVYFVVGNGERWRAPQPSRICRMAYHVNPQNGRIIQDTLSVYDCDRYIGERGQNIWKNLKERVAKSQRKGNAADYRCPQTVKEWIACFPEWTSDSISEHIFDAHGLVPEETVFPIYFHPIAGQDSAQRQIIEMRYGHRITTDSLYILFARKVCKRRSPSDSSVLEPFFTQTVMVYSREGQLKSWCDVTRNLPSMNRTYVYGRRKPFCLHVKEATLLKHDYKHTHYIPVLFKELEWRITYEGTLVMDTLWEEKCRWYPYKHPGVCEPWYKQLSLLNGKLQ